MYLSSLRREFSYKKLQLLNKHGSVMWNSNHKNSSISHSEEVKIPTPYGHISGKIY